MTTATIGHIAKTDSLKCLSTRTDVVWADFSNSTAIRANLVPEDNKNETPDSILPASTQPSGAGSCVSRVEPGPNSTVSHNGTYKRVDPDTMSR